jgi:hypothetical protein
LIGLFFNRRTYAAILSRSSEGREVWGPLRMNSLEFSPGKSLVNTLAFHNQVSHQTQGNVMLYGEYVLNRDLIRWT